MTDSSRGMVVVARGQLARLFDRTPPSSGRGLMIRFTNLPMSDRVALAALGAVILAAIFAPIIAPQGPYEAVGAPFEPPGDGSIFGTDAAGRDLFARCLFGLRLSLIGSLVVIAIGMVVGAIIGISAGIGPRWLDAFLMRVTDLFLAMPAPLLAIAVVAALGASFIHTLLAVSLVWWPLYARVFRGETRAIAVRPFMEAARISGVSGVRRLFRHLLPGLISPALVLMSLDIGGLVVTLASLSFLGLGSPAPAPELGAMAAQGVQFLLGAWWIAVIPGVAVFILALSANLAGDAIRDALSEH